MRIALHGNNRRMQRNNQDNRSAVVKNKIRNPLKRTDNTVRTGIGRIKVNNGH